MRRVDLAIHGYGILPGLLAIKLLDRKPGQSLLLLSGDKTVCGESLEAVVAASLSDAAMTLVAPFVVQHWPGYFVTIGGDTSSRDGDVLLLDPVQVWLELQSLIDPANLIPEVSKLTQTGNALVWSNGTSEAIQLLDLASVTQREQNEEIIGLEIARSLPWPVLVDLDTGNEPWDAFQHIPLGDDRVYVRKRNCRGDPEAYLTTGFGHLLSDLIVF